MNVYGKGIRDSKLTAGTKVLKYVGVGFVEVRPTEIDVSC
jgi:hypothetical protein